MILTFYLVDALSYCVEALRYISLKRHDQKAQLAAIVKASGGSAPSLLSKYGAQEWEYLAKWKRIWAARILSNLLDGQTSVEMVSNFYFLYIITRVNYIY